MDGPLRGIGVSTGFAAQCKECRQRDGGPDAGGFEYNVEWLAKIVDQGGNASDRCPSCRKEHKRRIRALPVPYVDLDTVGTVADRNNPQGPLGSLGPLPPPHEYRERTFDLSTIAFSLTDEHAVTLLEALRTKRVAVLIAGTGSGKSTFIPYRLLYPPKQDCLRLVERGPIIVTEPRREATARTAQMVARVLCGTPCGPGAPVGYRTGEEREDYWDEANQLLYVTDGSLLNWIKQGRLGNYGAIVIDEAHELNANIELILSLLAANLSRYPHLRVIIVSATIDPGPFVDLFGGPEKVEVLQIEDGVKDFGFGYPLWPGEAIDLDADQWRHRHWKGHWAGVGDLSDHTRHLLTLRAPRAVENPLAHHTRNSIPGLVADQVRRILDGTNGGEVLAFLPGKREIAEAIKLLKPYVQQNVQILAFSAESTQDTRRLISAKQRSGHRRVVVATNIAETSLTIPGLRYVVDSGLIKQNAWQSSSQSGSVRTGAHSQYGLRQRWGRVGRTEPGWVFPIYSRAFFEGLPASTPPAAARSNLEPLVLSAAGAGIASFDDLTFLSADVRVAGEALAEAFTSESARAQQTLVSRGAMLGGALTPLGRELQYTSGSVAAHTAMALADVATCAVEVATAFALMANGTVWQHLFAIPDDWPAHQRLAAVRHHTALRLGCRDDLDLALRIWAAWESATEPTTWARWNWLNEDLLLQAAVERERLLTPLSARVRRAEGVHRRVMEDLCDRARSVIHCALGDLRLTRSDTGHWNDRTGAAIRVDAVTAVPPNTESLLALTRGSIGGNATAAGVVLAPTELPFQGDWLDIAIGLAESNGLTCAEREAFEPWIAWQNRLSAAPVGAAVRISAPIPGQANGLRVLGVDEPPKPMPLSVDDDESGDLEQISSAPRGGDEGHIAAIRRISEDDQPKDDLEETPLQAPIHGRLGPSAFPVLLDELFPAPNGVAEVVRHIEADGATLPVIRPTRATQDASDPSASPYALAWDEREFRVTDAVVHQGRTLIELLDSDGETWVVGGESFSFNGRPVAGDLTPQRGETVNLTLVPGHSSVTPSLQPRLIEYLQSLPRIETFDPTTRRSRKGLEAVVTGTLGNSLIVELVGASSANRFTLRVEVRKKWLTAQAIGTLPGTRLVVFLDGEGSARVTLSRFPSGLSGRLPRGVTIDPQRGEVQVKRVLAPHERNNLINMDKTDPEWIQGMRSLWLAAAPKKATGVAPIPMSLEQTSTILLEGSEHECTVTRVTDEWAVVQINPSLPLLRVHRSRIGTGALKASQHLTAGTRSIIRIGPGPFTATDSTASIPHLATPSLSAQLLEALGGVQPFEGTITKVFSHALSIALPGDFRGSVNAGRTGIETNSYSPGSKLDVRVTGVRFQENRSGGAPWLQVDLVPDKINPPPGPGGQRQGTLVAGVWPGMVVETTDTRIRVQFEGGARRWVPWRNIGQHGLLFAGRHFSRGQQVRVEIAEPRQKDGRPYQQISILDVPTLGLDQQVIEKWGGQTLRDVRVTGALPNGLTFVEVWPEGRLNGAFRQTPGSPAHSIGDCVSVVVRGARVTHGKLQIDLVRV